MLAHTSNAFFVKICAEATEAAHLKLIASNLISSSNVMIRDTSDIESTQDSAKKLQKKTVIKRTIQRTSKQIDTEKNAALRIERQAQLVVENAQKMQKKEFEAKANHHIHTHHSIYSRT